jgi:stress response protein SCP2
MAINLVKGQTIDLRKNDKGESFDLSTVTIGLGWDIRKKSGGGGFLGKLLGAKEDEFDLDAIAFLLDKNGKVADLGKTIKANDGRNIGLSQSDVIFFNNMKHPSGNIWLTGDNRTGAGDGDDEQIIVKLDNLNEKYDKILFLVTVYQGRQRGQHFGAVENAFIRAVDGNGKEIAKFNLSANTAYNNMSAMVFAEVYRKEGTWKFRAIGDPQSTDSFMDILKNYAY